jgi:cell division protease FtsH
MFGRWGMSDKIGPRTQEVIDAEVHRIVEDAHTGVVALLTERRAQLDKLAEALLEHETLDEDDAYPAAGVEHEPSGAARDLAAAAKITTT